MTLTPEALEDRLIDFGAAVRRSGGVVMTDKNGWKDGRAEGGTISDCRLQIADFRLQISDWLRPVRTRFLAEPAL